MYVYIEKRKRLVRKKEDYSLEKIKIKHQVSQKRTNIEKVFNAYEYLI